MLNQTIIVGRIESYTELEKNIAKLVLAVTRNYKEEDDQDYMIDYIDIYLDANLSEILKYTKPHSIIAVKATLVQPKGATSVSILAQKVSMISDTEKSEE
jgi:hypothetical protein